jgi:trans-2,3-dihydro-3-hydroxyanthranilate isomerase
MKVRASQSCNYFVLDVFTDQRYRGNPLAVVLTEGDLELRSYENISREFGYSETSFVYYSKQEKALKVRSFTPTGYEIHGAGHNLLGVICLVLLKDMNAFNEQEGEPFVIMKDKKIYVSISSTRQAPQPVVGMLQQPAIVGESIPSDAIAAALSLDAADLFVDDFSPTVAETEVAHLMVAIRNVESLNKVIPNKNLLRELARQFAFEGVYCFAFPENDPQNFVHTRFFNPGIGIDEDPATGSAAGPLAGFLHAKQRIQLNHDYQLLQGALMNHPSTIKFRVQNENIMVSGSSVITMEGVLYE